mgnify:CR=1 FL=1
MRQLTAWIFIIIGVLMLLPLLKLTFLAGVDEWLITLGFLVIGIVKLTSK